MSSPGRHRLTSAVAPHARRTSGTAPWKAKRSAGNGFRVRFISFWQRAAAFSPCRKAHECRCARHVRHSNNSGLICQAGRFQCTASGAISERNSTGQRMGSLRNLRSHHSHFVTCANKFMPYADLLTLCTTAATSSCSTSHQSPPAPAAGLPPAAASSSARRESSAARRLAVCLRVAAVQLSNQKVRCQRGEASCVSAHKIARLCILGGGTEVCMQVGCVCQQPGRTAGPCTHQMAGYQCRSDIKVCGERRLGGAQHNARLQQSPFARRERSGSRLAAAALLCQQGARIQRSAWRQGCTCALGSF